MHDGRGDRGAAHPAERVVDTTGAGDLYAAGFLYGFTAGQAARGVRPARLDGGHRRARSHRTPPRRVARPAGRRRRACDRPRSLGARRAAAATAIAERTGVERHDVLVVLGSGWTPAADRFGDDDRRGADRRAARASPTSAWPATPACCARSQADGGRRSSRCSAGCTPTRATTSRRWCTRSAPSVRAGCGTVVVTNAAGGLRAGHARRPAGADQRPPQPHGPVAAHRPDAPADLGLPRFVDLTEAYSRRLRDLAREVDPTLEEGVYAGVPGPQYETPAEIRMLQTLGADLVGMSTVHEVIAARHVGAEVLGLSLVTNLAAGLGRRRPRPRRRARGRRAAPPRRWATSSPGWSPRFDAPTRCEPALGRGATTTPTRSPAPRSTRSSTPTTSTALRDRFGARLQFGTAGLRGALGAGPEPHEPRARAASHRRASRRGCGSRATTDRWSSAATPATAAPTSPRTPPASWPGAGFPVLVLPRPLPTPGHRVRHPPPGRGRRDHDHRQPQPAAGQRLQAVPRRRCPDRPARRRRRSPPTSTPSGRSPSLPLADDGDRGAGRRGGRRLPRRGRGAARRRAPPRSRSCTPRCTASGAETVRAAFARAGFPPLHEVREQVEPDPDFPTVAFPNPEEPGALDLAARARPRRRAPTSCWPTIPMPTGSASPSRPAAGGWRALTGDEIGALLADHLLRTGRPRPERRGRHHGRVVAPPAELAARRGRGVRRGAHRASSGWSARRRRASASRSATRRRSATASASSSATRTASPPRSSPPRWPRSSDADGLVARASASTSSPAPTASHVTRQRSIRVERRRLARPGHRRDGRRCGPTRRRRWPVGPSSTSRTWRWPAASRCRPTCWCGPSTAPGPSSGRAAPSRSSSATRRRSSPVGDGSVGGGPRAGERDRRRGARRRGDLLGRHGL